MNTTRAKHEQKPISWSLFPFLMSISCNDD